MSKILFSILILLVLLPSPAIAGKLEISSDEKSYRIGDLVTLRIAIEGKGFKLGDVNKKALAPFEYSGREEAFNEESGITTLTVKGHIFKVGDFTIPPFEVKDHEGKSYQSGPVTISVKALLKGDEQGIKPLKPQLEVDEGGPLWPWIAAALILAAIIATILFLNRMRGEDVPHVPFEIIPPHIEALKALERIEGLNLLREGKVKKYYTLVADVLRNFEGKIRGFDAMEMTTEELLHTLEKKGSEDLALLKKFLTDCDMVKFAKYSPPEMDVSALMERAREIIKRDMARQTVSGESSGGVKNMEEESAL
ncbi:MAG: BatD family protein [Deltaproteobacteria bacterium]|nr:BatD family protein [Deltaproteobacteria bacterium]